MVPPSSRRVSRVPRYSGSCCLQVGFAYGAFTLSGWLSQNHSATFLLDVYAVLNPGVLCTPVWAPSLSLAATRDIDVSFSSSGYLDVSVRRVPPTCLFDSTCGDWAFPSRVSPFRHLRVLRYLPLAAAFRSLSRLSSALSAKASALRSYSLDLD